MRKMIFKITGVKEIRSGGNNRKMEFPEGLEELTSEETKGIVAGEGIGFLLGYIVGKIGQLFS